ncbi:hypothetical protein ABZV60_19475 [Streptomyces sp. NPDC004787]|uniref:hypothetical protein n=1 Tax=Streptomyces sp. NPDC004787 TaxID=3154291 RepID=UPI0033AE161C
MATRTGRPRHCAYCTEAGADCCVRVHPDGGHVYAHRGCAARRGVKPMYVFTSYALQVEAAR